MMANSYVGTCPCCGVYGEIYRFNHAGKLKHACSDCKQKIITPYNESCNDYIMGNCSHPDHPEVEIGKNRGQKVIKHFGECNKELCPKLKKGELLEAAENFINTLENCDDKQIIDNQKRILKKVIKEKRSEKNG